MSESKRFIAYICPKCRKSIVAERSSFALNAGRQYLPCPCGGSELSIDVREGYFTLSVPCVSCGENHTVSCPARDFLNRKALAFSCKHTGLDCCYVGQEGPVYAALRRLEEAVDKLENAPENEQFLNPSAMEEVLSELKDLAQAGRISCSCGSKRWSLRLGYAAVDLICGDCGGNLRIPAATASDIEDLCCKMSLLIHGRT